MIIEKLRDHFNFAGWYTYLYSTGVGRVLRLMFQVEDRIPLMTIERDKPSRLCRCRVIPDSFMCVMRGAVGGKRIIVILVVHTESSTGND